MTTKTIFENKTLEQALALAANGMLVFPVHGLWPKRGQDGLLICRCDKGEACKNPGKHPVTKNGFKNASTDQAQIKKWWTDKPESSLAWVTGPASGMFVVDLDGQEAVDYYNNMAWPGNWPATRTVKTGAGFHLYFKHKPGIKNRAKINKIKGFDVRGDGGYVVAPPSLHKRGTYYKFLPACENPFEEAWAGIAVAEGYAEVPDELFDIIINNQEPEATKKARAQTRKPAFDLPGNPLEEVSKYGIILGQLSESKHRLAMGMAAFLAEAGVPEVTALKTIEPFATDQRDAVRATTDTYRNFAAGVKLAKFQWLPAIKPEHIETLWDALVSDMAKLGQSPRLPEQQGWGFSSQERKVFSNAAKLAKLAKTATTLGDISECGTYQQKTRCSTTKGGCGIVKDVKIFVCKRDACQVCGRARIRDIKTWWDQDWPKNGQGAKALVLEFVLSDESVTAAAGLRAELLKLAAYGTGKECYRIIGPGKLLFVYVGEGIFPIAVLGGLIGITKPYIKSKRLLEDIPREEAIKMIIDVMQARQDVIRSFVTEGDAKGLAECCWVGKVVCATSGRNSYVKNPKQEERLVIAKAAAKKRREEKAKEAPEEDALPCGCSDGGGKFPKRREVYELWKSETYINESYYPWSYKKAREAGKKFLATAAERAVTAAKRKTGAEPVPVG